MTTLDTAERAKHQTFWFAACGAVLLIQIIAEYMMGRTPICTCGYIKLWEGSVNSSGNSQHISDWYTPSHIIHGFIFYGVTYLLLRGKPIAMRLLLALVIESGWELLENSPVIIDRYRTATISLDYYGDSVLNSVSDILSMVLGFIIARLAPVWLTVTSALAMELIVGWLIRDNLTLNVIMLLWPMDWIKAWQGGA